MIEYKYEDYILMFESDNFKAEHIFECGQAFRWYKEDDESYTLVANSKVINVQEQGNIVSIKNTNPEDFESYWYKYFDLDKDYGQIKKSLDFNETLKSAMDYGYGIRILNQDIFETAISFIISANNRIPMIMSSIDKIAKEYGEKIYEDCNREYYSFPDAEILAAQDPQDLREICRVGFRDKRIVEASKLFLREDFAGETLKALDTNALRLRLMELPGVGPKVADCILLFAFDRTEVFPVDVWIKRVMETLFIGKEVKQKEIINYADRLFSDKAGYAQQYLFYYGRENLIGK